MERNISSIKTKLEEIEQHNSNMATNTDITNLAADLTSEIKKARRHGAFNMAMAAVIAGLVVRLTSFLNDGMANNNRVSMDKDDAKVAIRAGDIGGPVGFAKEDVSDKVLAPTMTATDTVVSEEINQLSRASGQSSSVFIGHNGPNPAKMEVKGDEVRTSFDGKITTISRGDDMLVKVTLPDGYRYNIDQADGTTIYYEFDKRGTMVSRGWRTGESNSGEETISEMAKTLSDGRVGYDLKSMDAIHFSSSSFPEVTKFLNDNYKATLEMKSDQKIKTLKTPTQLRGSRE